MRTFFSGAVALVIIAQPALALAVFIAPSDLLAAVKKDTSARSFGMEAHAHLSDENIWASVWANGAQEGGPDVASLKMQMKATTDLVMPDESMKVRLKMEVRVTDGSAYVKLDEASGTFEDDTMNLLFNVALKKWIHVPLDTETAAMISGMSEDPGMLAIFDDMFTLSHEQARGGNMYLLSLKPEVVEQIVAGLAEEAMQPQVQSSLKIDLSPQDLFQSLSFSASVDDETFDARISGNAKKMPGSLTVQVPASVISLEEFSAYEPMLDNSDLLNGLPLPGVPTEYEYDWSEEELLEPEESVNVPARRYIEKPSRRALRENARNRTR